MDYTSIIMMAIIQGVAEPIPVSSYAHLMLYSMFTSGQVMNLMQEVSVQLGTTLGFIVYFRQIIAQMIQDWLKHGFTRTQTFHSRLAWYLVLGTIPVGLVGLCCHHFIEAHFDNAWVIAGSAIVFGIVMGAVDRYARKERELESIGYKDAVIIGLIQIFALIPGASRSGVTMTAGRGLGITRQSAARFSFLLCIPVSCLAIIFQAKELIQASAPFNAVEFLIGLVISGVLGFIGITLFIHWVGRIGLMPFAIYRVLLGITIIVLLMNGVIV